MSGIVWSAFTGACRWYLYDTSSNENITRQWADSFGTSINTTLAQINTLVCFHPASCHAIVPPLLCRLNVWSDWAEKWPTTTATFYRELICFPIFAGAKQCMGGRLSSGRFSSKCKFNGGTNNGTFTQRARWKALNLHRYEKIIGSERYSCGLAKERRGSASLPRFGLKIGIAVIQ